MYQVLIDNKVEKEYTFKWQCVLWCIFNGYAENGGMLHWLMPKVEIKKRAVLFF